MTLPAARLMLGMIAVSAATPSAAQVAPGQDSVSPNTGALIVKPLEDFPNSAMSAKLAGNSRPADLTKWPASFYEEAGGKRCSATLIGPQTVLTAAHCVGDKEELKVVRASGAPITGTCHHPDVYQTGRDLSADLALCQMDSPVPTARYETVSTDARALKKGALMLTTGYGCVIPDQPVLSNKMAVGPMWIGELAGFFADSPSVMTSDGKHAKTAFLCKGDSGGAAYFGEEDGARVVIAVNVWVVSKSRVSYLAPLSTPAAIAFLDDWIHPKDPAVSAKIREICGLSRDLAHCTDTP